MEEKLMTVRSDKEMNIRPEDLDKFCFCCERLTDRLIGPAGVCPKCEKDQKWYETGSHSQHQKIRMEMEDCGVSIKQTVQILPHGRGWVVNGQKILK